MRKIRLDVDQLHVESFETAGQRPPREAGTVFGREATDIGKCNPFTDPYDSALNCPPNWTYETCNPAGCMESFYGNCWETEEGWTCDLWSQCGTVLTDDGCN